MIATVGKVIYEALVGILMLEACIRRIFGNMGNVQIWSVRVHYRIVRDASPGQVVRQGANGLLPQFIAAARELEADGADEIATYCGFLSQFQTAPAGDGNFHDRTRHSGA